MRARTPTARALALLALVLALTGCHVALSPPSSVADPPPSITGVAARSGPLTGGPIVTIRGHHLAGTTEVRFGASSSTDLQVISDSHVRVRAPAHVAGATQVRVVRPDATSPPSSAAVYDYLPAPAALRLGPMHPRPSLSPLALSCASGSLCVVGGAITSDQAGTVYGVSVKSGSAAWSEARPFSHFDVTGASCVLSPRRLCLTVGSDGYVSRYDGRSWTRTRLTSDLRRGGLTAVSCATSSFCQAVDGSGNAYRWNGVGWSSAQRITTSQLSDVSCPATTFCYALAGNDAMGVRWIGSRWVTGHWIAGANTHPRFISCSSATFCMASGQVEGDVLVFTGVAWSTENPGQVPSYGAARNTCTSPTFCAVPHGLGDNSDYGFAAWNGSATDTPVPGVTDVEVPPLIDCWAAYQCLSVKGHDEWRFLTTGAP